ncbi:hypothetical protein MCOR07_008610 [Pyricularia oryzae]|uniref:C2H2-type domain-containing protein n=3 Tax=Pyricularia oryzae TaxID=318829 RepID=G5EI37_PYRO7|nr:uncharacterized protein MGG_02775 [Pyricularia oryzae 70-15]ELQ41083.1 hypothetical protein OOU_Y34scaffold00301g3 [Pyricularia oryzae Y34]KAH8838314.1 hypothetical protein MCOR01_009757 [Pyricularia oryzae]EAQ71121.1 hypothetical protein MGCH7_ch7g528 [Pyricularia oryzae 70-15]EHA46227.1 hypothetical protein MGG_02775 [Pyricularia oryzae 70-15]KAI6324075.1 hypothetical protein MCOR34_001641 [Pyricularia oryzae]
MQQSTYQGHRAQPNYYSMPSGASRSAGEDTGVSLASAPYGMHGGISSMLSSNGGGDSSSMGSNQPSLASQLPSTMPTSNSHLPPLPTLSHLSPQLTTPLPQNPSSLNHHAAVSQVSETSHNSSPETYRQPSYSSYNGGHASSYSGNSNFQSTHAPASSLRSPPSTSEISRAPSVLPAAQSHLLSPSPMAPNYTYSRGPAQPSQNQYHYQPQMMTPAAGHTYGASSMMGHMVYHPGFPPQHAIYPHPPSDKSNSARPFKCSTCSVAFNRNHDLKRHTRIHLSVKPFPCKSCDKAFSRKDALKRHRLVKGCEAEPESKSNTEEKSPSQSKRDSESRSVSTELSPHTIAPPVYSLKGDYPYMKQDAYIKHESFIKTE